MRKHLLSLILLSIIILCTGCQSSKEDVIPTGTVYENSADTGTEKADDADFIFCGEKVFADVRQAGSVICYFKIPVLTKSESLEVTGVELDGIENATVEFSELEETSEEWSYGGYYYTEMPVTIELSEGECTIKELIFAVNGTSVKCEFPLGLHLEVCESSEFEFPAESGIIQATIPSDYDSTMAAFTLEKKVNLVQAELYSNDILNITMTQVATYTNSVEWEEGMEFQASKGEEVQITFEFDNSGEARYLSGPATIYVCFDADDETYVTYDDTYKEAVSSAEDVEGFVKAMTE